MPILGLFFACFGIIFLAVVGWSAGGIGRWLGRHLHYVQSIRWLIDYALIGLGVRLTTIEQ
jgi:threonine/homoserine/homoserine lactone efflux protein